MTDIHSDTQKITCEPLPLRAVTEDSKEDPEDPEAQQPETREERQIRKLQSTSKAISKISDSMNSFTAKVAMLSWYRPVLSIGLSLLVMIPMLCGFIFIGRSESYLNNFMSDGSNTYPMPSGVDVLFRSTNSSKSLTTSSSTLTRNVMAAQLMLARSVRERYATYEGAINAAALMLYNLTDDPFLLSSPIERVRANPDVLSLFENVIYEYDIGSGEMVVIGAGAARVSLPDAPQEVIDYVVGLVDGLAKKVSGGVSVGFMYSGAINTALDDGLLMTAVMGMASCLLALVVFALIGSGCFRGGCKGSAVSVGAVTLLLVVVCVACGVGISFYAGYPLAPVVSYAIPSCVAFGLVSVLAILRRYKQLASTYAQTHAHGLQDNDNDNNVEGRNYMSLLAESYRETFGSVGLLCLVAAASFACLAASDIYIIRAAGFFIGLASFVLFAVFLFVLSPYLLFDAKRRAKQRFDILCCLPKPRCESQYEEECSLGSYEVDSINSDLNGDNIKVVVVKADDDGDGEGTEEEGENKGTKVECEMDNTGRHRKRPRHRRGDKIHLEHIEPPARPPLSRAKRLVGSVVGVVLLLALFFSPIVCVSVGVVPVDFFGLKNSLPDGSEVNTYTSGDILDNWTALPLLLIGCVVGSFVFSNVVCALISVLTLVLVVLMSLVVISLIGIEAGGFCSLGIVSAVPVVLFCCIQATESTAYIGNIEKRFSKATKAVRKALPSSVFSSLVFLSAFIPQFFAKIGVVQLSSICAMITSLVGFIYEILFAAPLASFFNPILGRPNIVENISENVIVASGIESIHVSQSTKLKA